MLGNLFRIVFLFSFVFVVSCASDNIVEPKEEAYATKQQKKEHYEKMNAKADVYTSMARASKYNAEDLTTAMKAKIFSTDPHLTPKDVIKNIANLKMDNEGKMYNSLRILDFAATYAVANLSDDKAYADGYVYAKAAENLSKAAIKAHKDTKFSLKKEKEIGRIARDAGKELKNLEEKYNKKGKLSEDELYYKKGLEVGLLKLTELKKILDRQIDIYTQLEKTANSKDLKLEGKMFYELEDFDGRLNIDLFQHSAMRNRSELRIAKEFGKVYGYDELKSGEMKRYPEVAQLNINEYNVEDPVYIEKLEERAFKIANNLVDETLKYVALKSRIARKDMLDDPEERNRLKQAAFEELGIAMMAQVDLAYNIIELVKVDMGALNIEIHAVKREIKKIENKATYTQKVETLNKRVKLLELEAKESQMLGERALAIRSLYFYAGFEPFTRTLLDKDIEDIVKVLKTGFNEDVTEMLARVPEKKAEPKPPLDNKWAKEDNWLEDLLEKPESKAEIIKMPAPKPSGRFDEYAGEEFNARKTLQLGSYIERKNADIEWDMLKSLYPELSGYTPKVEPVTVDGKSFFRMTVESSDGGFKDLCNQMRRDKVECLLR